LKQFCGVEGRNIALLQRNGPIELAIRAFLWLETQRLTIGRSWFEVKTSIIREAVRAYLA
jgi:hypothetical protein